VTRAPRWPWFAAVAVLGLAAFALVLSALAGAHREPWWVSALGAVAGLVSLGLGLLIALRRPGNPIALLLFANAAILALSGVAEGYAAYAVLESPGALAGAEWAVLWIEAAWPLLFAPVVAIAFVFPDGRLPSRRWRRGAVGVAATFVGALVVGSLDLEPFGAPYQAVENPLPAVSGVGWLWPLIMLGGIASLFAAVRAVRVRFRRATGLERLQLKWLAYSSLLIPATLLVCLAFAVAGDGIDEEGAVALLVLLMLVGVPASVGVAVLRYRLYDIDRLVNRTLVYGVLTLLLAGTYGRGGVGAGNGARFGFLVGDRRRDAARGGGVSAAARPCPGRRRPAL
jgi:hypothetical protein